MQGLSVASALFSYEISIAITAAQEARTGRVLEALRDLSSPRVLVVRDGTRQRIASRDVVRGDLIVLSEGDRVPADALLIAASDLSADESLLTGEAEAVRKQAGAAEVTATGAASEIRQIGKISEPD